MARTLLINGVDFTSKWRWELSRWTSRAYMGESSQSEFVIDDDAGDINHLNLASLKIVEVWDDASGSDLCMYRGRVANKSLREADLSTDLAMQWTVMAEDINKDFRGIRVDNSVRPAETDLVRVEAYRAGYLNGSSSFNDNARDSTQFDSAIVSADAISLAAETYTDTDPFTVLQRIAEYSAKTFFAYVDTAGQGHLYYASHPDTSYASDISITDGSAGDDDSIYNPETEKDTGEHEGQSVITGGSMRVGGSIFVEASDVAGGEAFHDKWEEHFTDQLVTNEASAEALLEKIVHSRSNEQFTYVATFQMRAEHAHRIRAGMMVSTRLASANLATSADQRAVQVTHEPIGPDTYLVTVELGLPRGKPVRRAPVIVPVFPPTPTTPPGPPTPGSTAWTYTWNFESDNFDDATSTVGFMLGRQNGPGTLTSWWGDSGGGSNAGLYTKQAVTAGGSVNVNGRFAKNRLSTLSTSWYKINWFADILDVNPVSSTTIGLAASGSNPGVFATAASSTTVPAGIEAITIQVDNNLFADVLTISHTGAATPGTGGTAGNGLPEIIGSANVYSPIDHTHVVFRDAAPTLDDDEEHGFPEKTTWFVVDDPDAPTIIYEVWYLLQNDDGEAVWVEHPGGDDEEDAPDPASLSQVSTMHRFPVWGHRGDIGSDDSLPENTLESVRQVALKGGQGAEVDVRLSSEGTFYLMHDSTVDRTTDGTGAIASKTDSQIDALTIDGGYGYISGSYAVPTLTSVLDALNPYDFVLSIQLNASSDENAAALAQLVLDGGWAHRCVIEVSTLSEAAAIKSVSAALTTMVNNTVSGADADDNVDWLSMERATVTSLSVVTGKAPQHVKSYITIADFPADETSIIQNMWDRGVSAYQTANLDFALGAQRALLYAGGSVGELDDLSDVTVSSPEEDQQLQYVGGVWVNNHRRWEPVTHNPGGGPEIVWDGDDIVMTWADYS